MVDKKDIKELRLALKMSQKELADKLGVSVRTIANYESGGVIPESKYKILASLSDPIAKKIHTVITSDSSIRGNNNISNPSNLLVGDSNKNVQLGHGSHILNEPEVLYGNSDKVRIEFLEKEIESLKNQNNLLKNQLEDKERTIQILLNK